MKYEKGNCDECKGYDWKCKSNNANENHACTYYLILKPKPLKLNLDAMGGLEERTETQDGHRR